MPKNKIIAISFTDLHIHPFQLFNENDRRLKTSLRCLKYIGSVAEKLKVPVLFGGDLYHNPQELKNRVNSQTLKYFHKYFELKGIPFIAISGNHDMAEKNYLEHRSPSHLESFTHFKKFKLIDFDYFDTPHFTVFGIPYLNSEDELVKAIKITSKKALETSTLGGRILMLHTDLPGAKTPAGFELKEYAENFNLKKLFKVFDLVFCGHIHKPQLILGNVIMGGSPIHQVQSDAGTQMGYWEIYQDFSTKLIPLNDKFPTFKYVGENLLSQKPKDDKDYWLPVPVATEAPEDGSSFNTKVSTKKLVKAYTQQIGEKRKFYKNTLLKTLIEAKNNA